MVNIGTPVESPNAIGLRRSFRKSGAPVDGTSGTLVGVAEPGDILIDYTNTKLYVNANTKASPTWSQILTGGVAFAEDLDFSGAYTEDVIDFSGVTINSTGSNGPGLIRAGTYATPIANADEDQSGFMRLYGETSANGSSYDRGIFVCLKTTGLKGIFPIAGLAEVLAQSGAGPSKAQAAQFITMLQEATSKLATLGGDATAGMYAAWLKVGSVSGAVASAGSRVAAVWLDNQMNGTVSGEEYAAFITCGGSKVDAVFGFETTSSGWTSLFYFDETAYDQDPVVSGDATGGNKDYHLRVNLNGTMYGIQLYAL